MMVLGDYGKELLSFMNGAKKTLASSTIHDRFFQCFSRFYWSWLSTPVWIGSVLLERSVFSICIGVHCLGGLHGLKKERPVLLEASVRREDGGGEC